MQNKSNQRNLAFCASGAIALLSVLSPQNANGAIVLSEFLFNPDGAEYVVLTVSGPTDLANFEYSYGGGDALPGGTQSLSAVSLMLGDGATIVISRLPKFAFDLVHAVDSSAVDLFIFNSSFDLSSNFQFQITDTSLPDPSTTDFSLSAPSSAICCIIGPDGVTYIECDRPLTGNDAFVSTGTPSYVPEPSTALLGALGMLVMLRRSRNA